MSQACQQTQLIGPIFNMPVDIGVVVTGGDTTWTTIGDSLEAQTFALYSCCWVTAICRPPRFTPTWRVNA